VQRDVIYHLLQTGIKSVDYDDGDDDNDDDDNNNNNNNNLKTYLTFFDYCSILCMRIVFFFSQ